MLESRKVHIIMYHYVRQIRNSRYPDIRGLETELFYEQLGYLEKYYTFITIPQLISAIENGDSLPPNSVLLTFNDCYIDHFKNVFPALDSRGIQGCFYPEIGAVMESKVLLNHKIHFILAETEDHSALVEAIFSLLDSMRDEFNLDSNENYVNRLAVASEYDSKQTIFIKRLLQTALEEKVRNIIVGTLFEKFVDVDEKILHNELYLKEKQIKCMIRSGMHFGMLGYGHPRYDTLDREKQFSELKKTQNFLLRWGMDESELTASYPWGAYNTDTLDILRRLNCKAAFTTEAGVADLDNHSPLQLPRFDTNEMPTGEHTLQHANEIA